MDFGAIFMGAAKAGDETNVDGIVIIAAASATLGVTA